MSVGIWAEGGLTQNKLSLSKCSCLESKLEVHLI